MRKVNGTLYDKDNNVVKCRCGEDASLAMIGVAASIAYCAGCAPFDSYALNMEYVPPDADKILGDEFMTSMTQEEYSALYEKCRKLQEQEYSFNFII